jgi:alkylation response protein AidB-like acyl-CoA dehydrogenase
VLVVAGERAATVPQDALEVRPVCGIDPDAGWHAVHGTVDTSKGDAVDAATWESAVARGRRAIAHEMLGGCRSMLTLARDHAVDRVQFDRPIGSFQAVRHRLAEALVAIEALDATLLAASDESGVATAALAKATAGRTAHTVARHCQQVLAGIGFTTDHAFHRYLKRAMMLDGVFGSADRIATDLGRQLITARRVPTLIEL